MTSDEAERDSDIELSVPSPDSIDLVSLELRSFLNILEHQFPPPRRRHLWRIRNLIEQLASADDSRHLGDDLNDVQRTIMSVARMERSSTVEQWEALLVDVERHCQNWGTPWSMAALDAIAAGNLDRAYEWLVHADRLLPITAKILLTGLDQLEKAAIPVGRRDLAIGAGRIIVRHRPALVNLARLAWTLLGVNDYDGLDEVVQLALRLHGGNPDQWGDKPQPSLDYWLGTLCYVTNRWAIHFNDYSHDFHAFTTAAIRYFEASLAAGVTTRDVKYAPQWLASSVIYALRHYVDRLTDREFEHYGKLAERYALPGQKIELLIARLLRRPAREDPKSFARAVERALNTYDNLERSIPSHEVAARMRARWVDCLVEIDRIDDAARYASEPLFTRRAERAHRNGDDESAVALLLTALNDTTLDLAERIEYAILIGQYATASRSFSVSGRADAAMALAPLVPFIQEECQRLFEARMVSLVKRLLYPLLVASERLDATSVGIIAQFLRATIHSAKHFETEDRALWHELGRRELLREPSLIPLLFAHLDRMDVLREDLDDEELWDLANSVTGRFHNVTLLRCLRVLTKTPYFNADWPIRAYALASRSTITFDGSLLVALWENQGTVAIPALVELLDRLRAGQRIGVLRAFADLPAACFQNADLLDAIVNVCLTPSQAVAAAGANVLARGLAKIQMNAWADPEKFALLTYWSALILQAVTPATVKESVWVNWLDPHHEEFELLLTERLRASLNELQATLAENTTDITYWRDALDRFLRERLHLPATEGLDASEARAVEYLSTTVVAFPPQAIRTAIEILTDGDPDLETSRRMARIFVGSRRVIAEGIQSEVATVSRAQLHNFKNDLAKYADLGLAVPGAKLVQLRNTLAEVDSFLNLRRRTNTERFDLRRLVEAAVYRPPFVNTWQFGAATEARIFVYRPPAPIFADVDAELFEEAVHALVQNAWKAVIDLREAGYVSVNLSASHGRAVVVVSDNGGGAGKLVLEALNSPDDPKSRTKIGFGVRLAALIARLHCGGLRFHFTPGEPGLRAQFEIPATVREDN